MSPDPVSPIEALIFDLGDTLIYFSGEWDETFRLADEKLYESLVSLGIDLDQDLFLDEYRARMADYYRNREMDFIEITNRIVLCDVLATLGLESIDQDVVERALVDMYSVFQALWIPDPDALRTLQQLKHEGFPLGLVSNASDDANVQTLIDQAGVRPFFDLIITSAQMGIRKPNPRIFQPLLDHWKLPPERVAMVGDTLGADVLGAQNAGIFSIWFTRYANNPGNRAHKDTIHPHATIGALAELPDLLKNFRSDG